MSDASNAARSPIASEAVDFDAVIVGAGFSGLYMLHRLRQLGLSAHVFEAGDDIGGTWFWNCYPGARCDIESMQYSYQFDEALQQEWEWTERYAAQPEILAYINHVADRFDLRRDIELNSRVASAIWDDARAIWTATLAGGRKVTARYCIMATGALSAANVPAIQGIDTFKGAVYHTGNWPHQRVDFSHKRVAVIGTGSSGIQVVPEIAKEAAELIVFQRTAGYTVPARNRPLDPEEQRRIKAHYKAFREHQKTMLIGSDLEQNDAAVFDVTDEQRNAEYEARWKKGGTSFGAAFSDILLNKEANETAAEFIRAKIRSIVKDAKTADLLSPHHTFGCKRICLDTDYFETFNRPNVSLVDVSGSPIEAITPEGLVVGGKTYAVDIIVFATGFDALTGALNKIDIRGIDGRSLKAEWKDGPHTYLGLQSEGFPNLFMITGPQSPSVLTNMIPSIEQHVEFISDIITFARDKGLQRIEARRDAESAWAERVNAIAGATLYPSCNSWYLGSNIPGKPRVFLAHLGFPPYLEKCKQVAAKGYEGFDIR
jgi:cation diffusion facilitator CzcD-associated flavoprotein CzcO